MPKARADSWCWCFFQEVWAGVCVCHRYKKGVLADCALLPSIVRLCPAIVRLCPAASMEVLDKPGCPSLYFVKCGIEFVICELL